MDSSLERKLIDLRDRGHGIVDRISKKYSADASDLHKVIEDIADLVILPSAEPIIHEIRPFIQTLVPPLAEARPIVIKREVACIKKTEVPLPAAPATVAAAAPAAAAAAVPAAAPSFRKLWDHDPLRGATGPPLAKKKSDERLVSSAYD